jgi:hypothetical protein
MASLIEQLLGGSVVQRREAPQSNDLGQLLGFMSSTSQMQPVQAPQHQGGNVDIGSLVGLLNLFKKGEASPAKMQSDYTKSLPTTRFEGPTGKQVPLTIPEIARQLQGSPTMEGISTGNGILSHYLNTKATSELKDPGQEQVTVMTAPDSSIIRIPHKIGAPADYVYSPNGTPVKSYLADVKTQEAIHAARTRGGESEKIFKNENDQGQTIYNKGSDITSTEDIYKRIASAVMPNLVQVESGGNPNAVSNKGAQGLTQVMPETAKNPGYGVQPMQDNTPQENVRFGTDYLAALIKANNGDVSKALSAYNAGQNNQKAAGNYSQKVFGQSTAEKKAIEVNSALQTEKGKNQLDVQKAADIDKAAAIMSAKKSLPLYEKAIELLPTAVNGGADSAVNSALNYLGVPTEKSKAQGTLETVANELTASIKKAPGSQSDKELIFAQKQAGDLANTSLPVETRMAAAQYLKERNIKILAGESVQDPPEQAKTNVIKYDSQGNRIR